MVETVETVSRESLLTMKHAPCKNYSAGCRTLQGWDTQPPDSEKGIWQVTDKCVFPYATWLIVVLVVVACSLLGA